MARYVLDTNIFSAVLRREPLAKARIDSAVIKGDALLLCPVVYHEVCRGLLHRDSKNQLNFFLVYIQQFVWRDFSQADWFVAAQLWAKLRSSGYQITDNDLLIGVFAQQQEAILVTDNEKDFQHLDVTIENWRR